MGCPSETEEGLGPWMQTLIDDGDESDDHTLALYEEINPVSEQLFTLRKPAARLQRQTTKRENNAMWGSLRSREDHNRERAMAEVQRENKRERESGRPATSGDRKLSLNEGSVVSTHDKKAETLGRRERTEARSTLESGYPFATRLRMTEREFPIDGKASPSYDKTDPEAQVSPISSIHEGHIKENPDQGLKTQQNPNKLSQIVKSIDAIAELGKDLVIIDKSLSTMWRLLWTTEKEQLFIIKNASFFGTQAGDVLQVIDVKNHFLNNKITFPPNGVFFVRSDCAQGS
ncbi:Plastid lipid-associated protein/fibrillin conserved domain [Dillenia turbinata]|uniref:Plastid lipid-associated protein/fibrillin conserved domain n=1 Tax=Dillenia turbinata TaxID=194707 RepID=A0AAN8Z045_9MAGN